ncbi:MAG: glycosyltransferase family 39 protein [bacterium]
MQNIQNKARPPASRQARTILLTAIVLVVVLSIVFIIKTSVQVGGQRYFLLFDDAFISMRYAENWAHGLGSVWNPGEEKIEGYTNFGWMAIMALIHQIPAPKQIYPLIVQILGVLINSLTVLAVYRLGRSCFKTPLPSALAGLLLAFSYPWIFWGVTGMETGILTLLITIGLVRFEIMLHRKKLDFYAPLYFGIATLVRPEAILVFVALTLFMIAAERDFRQYRLIAFIGLACIFPIVHRTWAMLFYGDILPNTFYLKVNIPFSHRMANGISYSLGSLLRLQVPLFIAVIGVIVQPSRRFVLLFLPFCTLFLYQILVGGDSWHRDRFLWPVMPGVLVLCFHYILDFVNNLRVSVKGRFYLLITAIAACIFGLNATYSDEFLNSGAVYTEKQYHENIAHGLAVKKSLDETGKTAVIWAGASPYYSERPAVDLLGKSDRVIAYQEPKKQWLPGHSKFDWQHSIEELRPDIIERADKYLNFEKRKFRKSLERDYVRGVVEIEGENVELWFREGSPHVNWASVNMKEPLRFDVEEEETKENGSAGASPSRCCSQAGEEAGRARLQPSHATHQFLSNNNFPIPFR